MPSQTMSMHGVRGQVFVVPLTSTPGCWLRISAAALSSFCCDRDTRRMLRPRLARAAAVALPKPSEPDG
jgi:hypothetical protein